MSVHSKVVQITKNMVKKFGDAVNDHNPVHFDEKYAATTRFKKPIAHGALIAGLISGMLVESYGEGTIYVSTDLQFLRPIPVGSYVRIELSTEAISGNKHSVRVNVTDIDQQVAITGLARIIPGTV